jgi:hypothetical protein
MLRLLLVLGILAVTWIPVPGSCEEVSDEVYMEDIRDLKGSARTSAGFFVDGVLVSAIF